MANEKMKPQSPEEIARAAQEAALEQMRAMMGSIPGMPDMGDMQAQIMIDRYIQWLFAFLLYNLSIKQIINNRMIILRSEQFTKFKFRVPTNKNNMIQTIVSGGFQALDSLG